MGVWVLGGRGRREVGQGQGRNSNPSTNASCSHRRLRLASWVFLPPWVPAAPPLAPPQPGYWPRLQPAARTGGQRVKMKNTQHCLNARQRESNLILLFTDAV